MWVTRRYRPASPPPRWTSPLRGFIANVTQISTIQTESANNVHGNSTANAEKQFRGEYLNPNEFDDDDNPLPYLNEADPDAWEGWSISPVELDGAINWNQDEGAAIGNFGEDQSIPQIPGWGDSADGIVAEILGYLELSKGLHTLGVNSDDGFKLSFGPNPKDQLGIIAGEFEGGRGAADTIFNIVAEADGLYPVRLLWYEGGGGANVEFFSVDDKGTKILINDPDNADAIKAYRTADSAPYISRVTPTGGGLAKTIEFDFVNADLSVDKSSVKMKLNGEDASVTTKSTDNGISVVYDHGDYLPGGAHTVELSYTESGGTARVRNYSFSIPKGRIDILMDKPTVTVNFDDLTGTAGVGAIGNPDLTYVGGPELGVPALYPNGVGTAVRFDGSKDQRLRVADHPDINITNGPWEEMSWEFWFKPEKLPVAGETITLYEQGGNTRGIHIYLSGTQESDPTEAEVYMLAWNRAETFWGGVALNQVGGEGVTAVKSTVKLGSVYHVAFVMDGDPSGDLEGTLTGYINGRQVGQVSGVHLLYNHSDDIAFAYAAAQAVDHITGDRGEQPGLGFTGVLDDAAFYNTALSAEQVQAHFQGGYGSGDPQAIEITSQPQDTTAQEADTATFSVEFTGSPLVDVKWLVNGEEAATDAAISGSSINIVATEANNGAKVKAELTNSVGTVTTAEVTLTTVVDTTAPGVASAGASAGTVNEVTIAFNEVVNAATAGDAANYTIAGLTVNSATLGDDGKTVTLSTSQQTPGSYTVTITGVKDVSVRANTGNISASVESAIDYAAEVISDGPVIYWKLAETEGTVANDEMGNRTGVYVSASGNEPPTLGADSLVASSQDGAVHFNAANGQLMRVGDHAVMNVGGPYTNKSIELWFNADSLPRATPDADFSPKMIVWEQGGGWKAMIIYLNGTQDSDDPTKADLYFKVTSHIGGNPDALWGGTTDERAPTVHAGHADTTPVFAKTEVEVGQTYYVVAVMEGDPDGGLEGKLKLYVNGSLAAETGGVGQLYNHGNDAGMGGINSGSIFHDQLNDAALLGDLYHFNGTIDEFAEYNAVLTDDQIAGRYEVGNTSTAVPALATDKAGYLSGEDITVNFSNGLGNPADWVGLYRPDMTPGDVGSLRWAYVSGTTTAGEGLTDGAITFAGGLPAGSYVARFFENDGYTQIADAVAFTVVNPPGVTTSKAKYGPGESITINFSDGPGNPKDWVGLYRPDMTPGDVGSLVWAYVSGTDTAGEGLTDGSVTFANGMAVGDYKAIYFENDGYGQLASTTFSVAAAELPEGVLFAEDFDGLALGPWVSDSESGGDGTDWTATAPTGWVTATGDAHGATAGGDTVTEFDGWTFVDPVTWNATAGQDRSQFTKGSGAIAVADSDEFDDKADAKFNASLATPAIDISSSAAGSLVLTYDSSWRQEPQNGKVTVAFDGGDAVTLLELTPDTPTAYNETVSLNLDNPAGAQTAVITWEKQGHNNWWWAIDNIYVDASAEPGLLFGDNFDSDSSGNWAVHKSTDDTAVTFGYDYSADGIPAAPNSDGTTIGIKFEVNIAAPTVAEAVSISPAGGNFTGDYQVKFDMWINANGPFPGGGGGSTEFFTAGVGTTGDHLQWAADTADGAWFGVTGEGGSGNSGDFRAHIGGTRQAAESGAYAAGTTADSRNNNNAHYADAFPGQSPPAAQAAAFPDKQTGAVANGAVGFAWRQVTITKIGDSVTWAIDGVTIATLEQSLGAFTTEGNIFVGYYDAFSSVSDNAATSFGLVDNIRVVEIQTTVPPTLSIVNNGDGSVTVTFEGTLQAANSVNGPWADVEGATSPLTIPSDQAAQFGRAVK